MYKDWYNNNIHLQIIKLFNKKNDNLFSKVN